MKSTSRGSIAAVGILMVSATPTAEVITRVTPKDLPRIGVIDERFQSYNVEMVEVTGGLFWKPYDQTDPGMKKQMAAGARGHFAPAGGETDVYAAAKGPLEPIDLANEKLRKLAAALGPAYVRVSGSDANAVYFHDSDEPPPRQPPEGFRTVLTREQWRGVIDFTRAVNGKLVTSFAVSKGVRDAKGNWKPDQARALMSYTKAIGGEIAAAELVNEPNITPSAVYTPPGYNAQMFARDFAAFRQLAKSAAPHMLLLGPGSTSEGVNIVPEPVIPSAAFLGAKPQPMFDVLSYHLYGASSMRCTGPRRVNTLAEDALTHEWLARADIIDEYYARLRDRFLPRAPLWLTETAQASCGADPWAATFLDTFRYLDQLGIHARRGVQVVMHNTLAVSEYGLLDRNTKEPRPNYWGALLWRRLMGTTVLDSTIPIREGLHLYAHCMRGTRGGVTLLAINNSRTRPQLLELPVAAQRYTLSARTAQDSQVQLNGKPLAVAGNGDLPPLTPVAAPAGRTELAPLTITFLAIPDAANAACQ